MSTAAGSRPSSLCACGRCARLGWPSVTAVDGDAGLDDLASFRLDGSVYYVRWHSDGQALDAVVPSESGDWAFPEMASCQAAWPSWHPQWDAASAPTDFDSVSLWLRGLRLAMPNEAVLEAWNLAGDVARGVGLAWHDRGPLRDRVYDKLLCASVPWFFGRDQYAPRWSPREHRAARQMATQAVALVRTALR